jgi:hypothetical protein
MDSEMGCILYNVNSVVKKRLDTYLREAKDVKGFFKSEREQSADAMLLPSLQLHLPAQNTATCIPLIEFENGRALTIMTGMYLQIEFQNSLLS